MSYSNLIFLRRYKRALRIAGVVWVLVRIIEIEVKCTNQKGFLHETTVSVELHYKGWYSHMLILQSWVK